MEILDGDNVSKTETECLDVPESHRLALLFERRRLIIDLTCRPYAIDRNRKNASDIYPNALSDELFVDHLTLRSRVMHMSLRLHHNA